jgi:hypothetical protein
MDRMKPISMRKDGKELEELVFFLQKSVAPDALIRRNERIKGVKSKSTREIDISIRQRIGHSNILIVVECKDYGSPVHVKHMESFIEFLKDVQANKGIMVSSNAFTEGARNRAIEAGIDLYSLSDIKEKEAFEPITIPFLCQFLGIKWYQWKIESNVPQPIALGDNLTKDIHLVDYAGVPIGSGLNILHEKWNNNVIPHKPGQVENIEICNNNAFIPGLHGDPPYSIVLHATISIEITTYFAELPLEIFKTYKDEIAGKAIAGIYKTKQFTLKEVENIWRKITSPSELPMKPKIILRSEEYYDTRIESKREKMPLGF